MPYRMSWTYYLSFAASALASLLLGASVVHNYYKPSVEVPEVPPSTADKPSSIVAIRSGPNRNK